MCAPTVATVLTLPRNNTDVRVTATVLLEGVPVHNALLDTGASVTIVNKALVDTLGLTVSPSVSREIVVANDASMNVEGECFVSIQLAKFPIRVHALNVPSIAYELIIGTNELRAAGVKLTCDDREFFPEKSDEKSYDFALDTKCVVSGIGEVVLPPLHGYNVRGRVHGSMRDADVLLEATKRKMCDSKTVAYSKRRFG
jgi:predicted aspartyl protease